MPCSYIDTDDQQNFVRDELGLAFVNAKAARDAAVAALPGMARDALPTGNTRTFLAVVRDDQERILFRASLALSVVASD